MPSVNIIHVLYTMCTTLLHKRAHAYSYVDEILINYILMCICLYRKLMRNTSHIESGIYLILHTKKKY